MRKRTLSVLIFGAMLVASPALAHPGHEAASFGSGLAHPFGGLDHMLAMVAVGLWASQRGASALWAWPAAFVAAMLAGYGLGVVIPGAPLIEPMIMASVVMLGAATAANAQVPVAAGLALIAAFGLAHGYAHGSESPAGGLQLAFPLAFALSTLALHLSGLGVGAAILTARRPALIRVLGAGTALGGLLLAAAG